MSSILLPKGKFPVADQLKLLDKQIDICKRFTNASNCTRISLLVSFIHDGRYHHEVLLFDNEKGLPVPKEEMQKFMHSLDETLINNRLSLLENHKEVNQ